MRSAFYFLNSCCLHHYTMRLNGTVRLCLTEQARWACRRRRQRLCWAMTGERASAFSVLSTAAVKWSTRWLAVFVAWTARAIRTLCAALTKSLTPQSAIFASSLAVFSRRSTLLTTSPVQQPTVCHSTRRLVSDNNNNNNENKNNNNNTRLSFLIQRYNAVAVLGTFTHTTPEDEM